MAFRELKFTYAYQFADRTAQAVYAIPEEEPFIDDHLEFYSEANATKAAKPTQDTLLHTFVRSLNFSDLGFVTGTTRKML